MLLENKKKTDRKKTPLQILHPPIYSLYIQGLLYLCRDKNTQVLQQDVVLQVVIIQAWKKSPLLWSFWNVEKLWRKICAV